MNNSNNSEYIPGIIYENLLKMLEYRAIKLTSKKLTTRELTSELNSKEFHVIHGKREKNDNDPRHMANVMIYLIAPKSAYSLKASDFKTLFKGIIATSRLEIMFVSELPLTTHINKFIDEYREDNVFIENYDYSKFMIVAPEHISVPRHHVVMNDELEELKTFYMNKEFFQKIHQNDTQAVWLGLRPGMICKIDRLSETTGTSVAYRTCIGKYVKK